MPVLGVEEQPVVKPNAAYADVKSENLKTFEAEGCHTAVVGLDIQDSEQRIVNYFIKAILMKHPIQTRHEVHAICI